MQGHLDRIAAALDMASVALESEFKAEYDRGLEAGRKLGRREAAERIMAAALAETGDLGESVEHVGAVLAELQDTGAGEIRQVLAEFQAAPEPVPALADAPVLPDDEPTTADSSPSPFAGPELSPGINPWSFDEDNELREIIASKPVSMEEIRAAVPGRTDGGLTSRCYALGIARPTKQFFERNAALRQAAAPNFAPTAVEQHIHAHGITRADDLPPDVDTVMTEVRKHCGTCVSENGKFEFFRVDGKRLDRAQILALANKHRLHAGKRLWLDEDVDWSRKLPGPAPKFGNVARRPAGI